MDAEQARRVGGGLLPLLDERHNFLLHLGDPSTQELARYFHLDDSDHTQIVEKRGDANRLGFALQARAGRWLEDAERTYAAILMVEPDSAEPVASCPVSWSSAM